MRTNLIHPIFGDEPTLYAPETPADYWQILAEICPVEIRRELPSDYRPSRSGFFLNKPIARGETPFVFVHHNEGEHWNSIRTLAHEVGHALDYYGQHPAQDLLGRATKSQGRFRQELAATTFCAAFLRATGLTRQKGTRRYIEKDRAYVERYKRPVGVARYPQVLAATKAALM